MKNKNTDPIEADYIIGNYNIYVADVYNALERLEDFMKEEKFKRVVESQDDKVLEKVDDACVLPDFTMFLDDIKHAMGY